VVERRDFSRELRYQRAVGPNRGQRLQDQTPRVVVLGALGQVRVEDGGCLPEEHAQGAALTAARAAASGGGGGRGCEGRRGRGGGWGGSGLRGGGWGCRRRGGRSGRGCGCSGGTAGGRQ